MTTIAMILSFALGYCLSSESHNESIAADGWILSIIITASSALMMLVAWWMTKKPKDESSSKIETKKELVATSTIPWLICGIYAALPYIFCSPHLPLEKALFEAVSGLTTTGATVITDLREIPKTLLVWRSLTQWLGGLGIIILSFLIIGRSGGAGGGSHSRSDGHDPVELVEQWLVPSPPC